MLPKKPKETQRETKIVREEIKRMRDKKREIEGEIEWKRKNQEDKK